MDAAIGKLSLTAPPKRALHSARFTFDLDLAHPKNMSHSSSFHGLSTQLPLDTWSSDPIHDDDLFTLFEQSHAAVPFKWEEIPGTPKYHDPVAVAKAKQMDDSMSGSEQEYASASPSSISPISRSLSSSTSDSVNQGAEELESQCNPIQSPTSTITNWKEYCIQRLQSEDPNLEFQCNPIQSPTSAITNYKENGIRKLCKESSKQADNLSPKTQILPLKPPPAMQPIKHLFAKESEKSSNSALNFSSRTVNTLINSCTAKGSSMLSIRIHPGRSFRKDGLKALPFLSSDLWREKEEFQSEILGLEEWPKVVEQQEKKEKKKQDLNKVDGYRHHRIMSMPRVSFSFKKKHRTEKESGKFFLDVDSIFSEDFSKISELREHRPLSSVSARTSADGYRNSTRRSWVYDSESDYSECEMDGRSDIDGCHIIQEGEEEVEVQLNAMKSAPSNSGNADAPKAKRKNYALSRLRRFFKKSSKSRDDLDVRHQKPSRLSSVSPAPPPPMARTQSELKLKKTSGQREKSSAAANSFGMCYPNPISEAFLKNFRQFRAIEFHTPRKLMSK